MTNYHCSVVVDWHCYCCSFLFQYLFHSVLVQWHCCWCWWAGVLFCCLMMFCSFLVVILEWPIADCVGIPALFCSDAWIYYVVITYTLFRSVLLQFVVVCCSYSVYYGDCCCWSLWWPFVDGYLLDSVARSSLFIIVVLLLCWSVCSLLFWWCIVRKVMFLNLFLLGIITIDYTISCSCLTCLMSVCCWCDICSLPSVPICYCSTILFPVKVTVVPVIWSDLVFCCIPSIVPYSIGGIIELDLGRHCAVGCPVVPQWFILMLWWWLMEVLVDAGAGSPFVCFLEFHYHEVILCWHSSHCYLFILLSLALQCCYLLWSVVQYICMAVALYSHLLFVIRCLLYCCCCCWIAFVTV